MIGSNRVYRNGKNILTEWAINVYKANDSLETKWEKKCS